MLKHRAALLLALPTFAFAACGGDSDEDKVKAIINDGAADPVSICGNLSNDLLKQVGGSQEACEKTAAQDDKGDKPENLKVTVDGDKATATFKDDDGDNKIRFAKQGDDWKVTSIDNSK